jgi:hypothetical protein
VLVERFQDSARVKAWRSADEHDHLLKLEGAKLRYNLFDAALVEQQDSRDHILGHALSGGPAHFLRIEIKTEAIGHTHEHNPLAERMHQQARLSVVFVGLPVNRKWSEGGVFYRHGVILVCTP